MSTLGKLLRGRSQGFKAVANGTTAIQAVNDVQNGQVLSTVKQLAENPKYPFSEPALRHLIFQSESRYSSSGDVIAGNGLTSALVRVGRRIYVDIAAFDLWLNDHRQQG